MSLEEFVRDLADPSQQMAASKLTKLSGLDTGQAKAVEAALDSLVGAAMVEHLARYYDILDDPEPIRRILLLSGRRIVDPLIARLADSEERPSTHWAWC